MTTLIVVGAQWGDEGKGKVVDYLASQAQVVARYGGGNNAGHTLVIGGQKLVTHLVPSGCAYPGTLCVLGAGMVIDIDVFRGEVEALQATGKLQRGELRVSLDAHVILPHHRQLDGLREDRAQAGKIGTTRRGIGPAYEAKAGRRGVRIRDLFRPERLRARLEAARDVVDAELARLGASERLDVAAEVERAAGWAAWLADKVCDAGALVDAAIREQKRVLFEGAQGALLDVDHGTYPFVTSSSAIAGGACTGVGVGPSRIGDVIGITKTYTTHINNNPFPTELLPNTNKHLHQTNNKFDTITKQPQHTN